MGRYRENLQLILIIFNSPDNYSLKMFQGLKILRGTYKRPSYNKNYVVYHYFINDIVKTEFKRPLNKILEASENFSSIQSWKESSIIGRKKPYTLLKFKSLP